MWQERDFLQTLERECATGNAGTRPDLSEPGVQSQCLLCHLPNQDRGEPFSPSLPFSFFLFISRPHGSILSRSEIYSISLQPFLYLANLVFLSCSKLSYSPSILHRNLFFFPPVSHQHFVSFPPSLPSLSSRRETERAPSISSLATSPHVAQFSLRIPSCLHTMLFPTSLIPHLTLLSRNSSP